MLCLRPANRFFSTNSVESGFIGLFGQVSHPCIPAQHARRPDLRLKLRLKLRINVQDQCEGTFLEIGACLAPWPRQHACAAQRPTAPPCICVLDAVAEIACVSPYQGREMESQPTNLSKIGHPVHLLRRYFQFVVVLDNWKPACILPFEVLCGCFSITHRVLSIFVIFLLLV